MGEYGAKPLKNGGLGFFLEAEYSDAGQAVLLAVLQHLPIVYMIYVKCHLISYFLGVNMSRCDNCFFTTCNWKILTGKNAISVNQQNCDRINTFLVYLVTVSRLCLPRWLTGPWYAPCLSGCLNRPGVLSQASHITCLHLSCVLLCYGINFLGRRGRVYWCTL